MGDSGKRGRYAIPDRERGAQKRLSAIMAKYPKLAAYIQGDPRGCALYVYEKAKLDEMQRGAVRSGSVPREIDSVYNMLGTALCF